MGILKSLDPGFTKASNAIAGQIERRGLETSQSWDGGILVIQATRRGEIAFRVALKPLDGGLEAAIVDRYSSSYKFRHSQRYDVRGSHQSLTTALDNELGRHPDPSPHDRLEDAMDSADAATALKDFLVERFGDEGAREVLEAARISLDEEFPPGP